MNLTCPNSVEPRTNWQQNLQFFADLFDRVTGSIKRNCLDYLLPLLLFGLSHYYGYGELAATLNLLRLGRGLLKRENK